MAFNLTAQLNLVGPTNIKQIASQIKKDLGNINATVQFKLDPNVAKNVAGLSSSLKALNSTFANTVTSATAASSAIKSFGNSINSIKINNIPQKINATANSITSLNKESTESVKALAGASGELVEFGKQAGLAVRRFLAFSAVTSIIYGVTNSINNGVQAFIDYDKELVKLQQVTGESASGLAKLQSQITNLSVAYGVSSKELTTVASTLAQAGLSARETEKALKALALSSLAPSFDGMNETVEGSIALMRQFGISAEDLEASLGSVNTVAARFAVESKDIITAIQRTGSVFATASKGVSEGKDALNEFIAVFTSVRATTRESAETIATGLRTIFTRVQRGQTIDALKEFGVNLTDAEGKFVGAYKAVELLSSGLNKLDPRSLDFSRIVEELGGFRQIGKVIPLIQQFAVTQEALKVAQRGQGSLARDAATAQLSLANQISKVREEFFALFREIGQSKGFQTLIRGALSLVSGLIKVTDAVKGILPALAVITAFKGAKGLTQFIGGFNTGVKRGPDGKANGGVIRKFARGGVVPGVGSGDTVPAMLEPGEFVIRKKAVETIGANNLHSMNKYGGGGSIRAGKSNRRKRFANAGMVTQGGKLYDDIDPLPFAKSNKANAGKLKASDGDSITVAVDPTKILVDRKYKKPDNETLLYPNEKGTFKTSSRLDGVDAFEMRLSKQERQVYGGAGGPAAASNRQKARAAKQITIDFITDLGAENVSQAFKDTNQVDVYGRPLLKLQSLNDTLIKAAVAKEHGTGSGQDIIQADKLANRLEIMQNNDGFENKNKSSWDKVIRDDYMFNYLPEGAPNRIINGKIQRRLKGEREIFTLDDNGFVEQMKKTKGIAKFMSGGTVDSPKLIQRGTLSYSLEDILKAGLTEEQFLEKIPVPPPLMAVNPKPGEYGTQFKIGGVGSGSVPMPKFLKPYLPPDTAAFQSSQDAVFKRSEAAVEYRKKKGLMPRDYEGKSSTEKSFLAAKNRGYNSGGMVQKFMAGGKAESTPFGTGETKFPKRITNAYAKELQKKLDKEKVDNAWYPYPSNERITIDPEEVSQKFQNEPFDRKRFLSLFNTKISRNELVGNLSDFAKFIGLPGEDLAKVLPQTIDFGGELQRSGNRGTFSRDPFGTQGYDDKGLEAFGFTQVDEQDLFGYQKLMDEKTKEIQKIMKTPTRTFDDGSFSYDSDAFTKAMDEKSSLGKKISDIMGKKAVARKGLMEQKKGVLASTGRGFVSMASNSFERNQPKNVLYHELTHQLLNSLRTQSEDSFTKYKERVSQLFNGDNDDLADAFDALGGSYNSADVVYGRSYKNGLLNNVLQDLRRKTMDAAGRSADPDLSKEAYSMWVESGQQKNAREYRPINPKINDILLKGGQKQETLEKVEDYGKEEFLTTLIQNAPKLDSNMAGILDSTLNELLSNAGIQRQQYAEGGKVQRNIGIIDTDVLRDPANANIVGPAMEKLGITNTSLYSIELGKLAAQARKDESLSRLTAIAGAAGSGKSSLATGKGASDDASLRKTVRSSILTPEDIAEVNEVIVLTSTTSQEKLDAYLKDVDRAYVLSSNERSEQDRVGSNRQSRDNTGEGLYGRKPGTTNSASRDFALEESILRDELGDKAMVLGRKPDSFGLRRKKEGELPEIVQAGGYYTGGFAPPTRGHRGAFDTLLSNMISKNPNASAEDIIVSVAPNLSMDRGEGKTEEEKLAHAARYGIFPADFRALLAGINFPKGMISASAESTGRGDVLPKMMEVQGANDRRKFAKLKGALAITSGKKAGALDKYEKAGVDVTDIPRIEDISATKVRQAVIDGDDKALTSFVSPEVASVLMGNRAQLRNRSMMVPMLIEEITKYGVTQKAQTNAEIQKMLAEAPGGPYGKNITQKVRDNAPDVVAQIEAMREQRDALSSNLLGYRAHNIISLLSAKYPDAYGLDPSRRASVSAQPSDLAKDIISAQLSEGMAGEFGGVSTATPSSGLQEAILKNVGKATQVKKSSGILPAQGSEILKRFGSERLPNDPSFGPFSGKTVGDTSDGGKLKYWQTSLPPATNPEKQAYYFATRDYLIQKFNESQGTKSAQALSDTTSAVLSSQQLGLVGLNPLGYTGLLGPETWNLGTDPSGQERSIDASIVQRGLPNQYQNVIDYLSGQTEEIVGGASKLLGIVPNKLSKKQRETLGQGNIEGALLEQIFGSAGAGILDDALRTRPIDFPMGIGPKAASIFGIDPSIPTEVKRTIDSNSRGKAVEEFQRYFRQKYGIPDPEKAVQKLADGGSVEDKKKEKNFGKIGIKNSGSEIIATYLGKKDRSGMVSAKKMKDNLYTIGLSKATKGYGPKLYDIVMEAATANGGMLAPDRNIISGAAKDVWSYYFNKRSDVRKTPLDKSQWTQNSALIDPKLLGEKNTWPPYSDPAWTLQTGYSKSPELLNSPDTVNLNDEKYKAFLQSQQLSFFAKGGSVQDTVPALLTPGEFVINKKAAQNIGYGKLNELNKADKIQGFNKGGVVGGVIQKFADGGNVLDMLLKGLQTFNQPAVQKLQSRPSETSSSTIEVSSEISSFSKNLVDELDKAGYSMKSLKNIIEQMGKGADISYKQMENALEKDLQRLKISGASIEATVQAEKALSDVRNQSKANIVKRQFLEAGFKESKVGKALGSGASQQKILMEAEKKEKLIIAQRRKELTQSISSIPGGSGPPLSLDKIKEKVQELLDAEAQKIKESALIGATQQVTGVKKSELESMNIGSGDIKSYITQSTTDRKTLAQMDKQLIAGKIEELRNSSDYKSASNAEQRKLLNDTMSLAKEEVSKRRQIINEIAKEDGSRGVGAAGLTDFRNSPVLNAVKGRYFDGDSGRFKGSTALGDVGMVAGLVGGQGENIANQIYDTKTDSGKVQASKTSVAIQNAGSTLATGLTTAAQLAPINPVVAALVAVGTAAYAAAESYYDFSGAQEAAGAAMEKSIRADKIAYSTDILNKSFETLMKSTTDLALKMDYVSKAKTLIDLTTDDSNIEATTNKKDQERRTWSQYYWGGGPLRDVGQAMGISSGNDYAKEGVNGLEVKDYQRIGAKQAEAFSSLGNQGYQLLSEAYKQGFSREDIIKNMDLSGEDNKTGITRDQVKAMVLSDPNKAFQYQVSRSKGEDVGDRYLKEETDNFLNSNAQALAAEKANQMARALELADKAGRRLSDSFELLAKNINEAIGRTTFESDARIEAMKQDSDALRGKSESSGPKLRELNVLNSPSQYTDKEYDDALSSATSGIKNDRVKQQIIGGSQLEQRLPKAIKEAISTETKGKASLDIDEAKRLAITAANSEIDKLNLQPEQKEDLKAIAKTKIDKQAEASRDAFTSQGDKAVVDNFLESLNSAKDITGDFSSKMTEVAKELLSFRQGALKQFAEGLNASSKALKDSKNYEKKARDIRNSGNMNFREVTTGVGETFEERQARMNGDVASLTGGITGVAGIKNRMLSLQTSRQNIVKAQGATGGDPAAAAKLEKDLRAVDDKLRDTAEALEILATSTELVEKAFNDLKNVRELQKNRESFVNTLLTNTPEEADKLNQTFIRLQRNLSGGLNDASNQRDARKAFNQTLRETGSVREATKSGNTVLANQRKETLAAMNDPGFQAAQELNIRNQYAQNKGQPGVTADEAVADYFKNQQLQVMKSMAVESGMINNPLVRQAIAAKEDPTTEPAMAQAADRYLKAVGLQSDATKAQGELALLESQQILAASNNNLKTSIDDLNARIDTLILGDAGGAKGIVGTDSIGQDVVQLASRGGLMYAQQGQYVNFQPKGTDTIPAMLTPGEFVINAKSTAEHLPLLQSINSGNYSKGGVVYLADGGKPTKKDIKPDMSYTTSVVQPSSPVPLVKMDTIPYGRGVALKVRPDEKMVEERRALNKENSTRRALNKIRPDKRTPDQQSRLDALMKKQPNMEEEVRLRMIGREKRTKEENEAYETLREKRLAESSTISPEARKGYAKVEERSMAKARREAGLPRPGLYTQQSRVPKSKNDIDPNNRLHVLWGKGKANRSSSEQDEYNGLLKGDTSGSIASNPTPTERVRAGLSPITSNGGKPDPIDPATAARINASYTSNQPLQNSAISTTRGKYPKTDGTRADNIGDADFSKFATKDWVTLANDPANTAAMARQIAQHKLFTMGLDKDGKLLAISSGTSSASKTTGANTANNPQTGSSSRDVLDKKPNELTDDDLKILDQRLADPADRGSLKAGMLAWAGRNFRATQAQPSGEGVSDTSIQNPTTQERLRAETEAEERRAALTTNIINQALNKKTPNYSIATPTSGSQTTKTERPTREFMGSSESRRALSAVANSGGTLAEADAAAKNAIKSKAERSKSIVEKRQAEGKKVINYYEQRLNEARADNDGDGQPDFSKTEIDKRKKEWESSVVNFGISGSSRGRNPILRKPLEYYGDSAPPKPGQKGHRWNMDEYSSAEDYFAAQGARQDYLDRQSRTRKANEASAAGAETAISHVANMTPDQYAAAVRASYGDGVARLAVGDAGKNNEDVRIKDEEKKTRETFDRAKNYEGPLGTAAYVGDTFTQGVVGALPQDRVRNDSQDMKDMNARRDAYKERERLAGNKDFSFENSSNPIFAGMGSAGRSATTMYQGTLGAGLNVVGGVSMNSAAGYADTFGNPLLATELRRKGDDALTAATSDVQLLGTQASRTMSGQTLAQVQTAGEKLDAQNIQEAGSLGSVVRGAQLARDFAVDAALPLPIPGAGKVRSVAGRLDDMDKAAEKAYKVSQRAYEAAQRSSIAGATESTIPKMIQNYLEKLPIPSEATGPMGSMGRLSRGEGLSRSLKDLREVKVPSLRSDPMDMSKLGKSAKQSQTILDPLEETAKSANKPRITASEYTRLAEEAKAAKRASKPRVTAEEFMARTKPDVTTLPTKRPLPEVIDVTDTKTLRQVQENLANDLADYATPAKRDQFLSEFVEKSTPQSVSIDPKALANARQKHAKTLGPTKKIPEGMVTSDNKMIFRDANTKTSIVQHELAHSFQTKTAGMKIDPFGGKRLRLSGVMKEIESFIDDPKGLVAITGGKGYSASQLKQAPHELLSTLMQHMDKVKGNKRAEKILKELMKFHGYNKGGVVSYFVNGGQAANSIAKTGTTIAKNVTDIGKAVYTGDVTTDTASSALGLAYTLATNTSAKGVAGVGRGVTDIVTGTQTLLSNQKSSLEKTQAVGDIAKASLDTAANATPLVSSSLSAAGRNSGQIAGKMAPMLAIAGGVVTGLQDEKAIQQGVSAPTRAVFGAISGSASPGGSITSKLINPDISKNTDERLAQMESTARGAAIGASAGSVVPVVGPAAGAAVGGAIGFGSETIKVGNEAMSTAMTNSTESARIADKQKELGASGVLTPQYYTESPEYKAAEREKQIQDVPKPAGGRIMYASGGLVYANNGALVPALSQGTDTVPAMLTPGEFVINREASQKHMPLLNAINSGHFNRGGIVNYLANGGAVAPQYSANGGPAKTGGGVSKDAASSSVGDALSAAVKSAVNDFNNSIQKGMESYSSMMQSSVEQMNSFGQTFSNATQTLANSAGTYSEAANTMPNSLTAQITGTQQVNITGLGAEGERIIGGASTAGALAGRQTSQNTVATYDRKELDGGLNTASKNKPITG